MTPAAGAAHTQPVIAVIAAGAMGSGVAGVLSAHGARVLTLLEGRSEASRARAAAAGMVAADLDGIAAADIILSIVPPAEARPLADLLAPALLRARRKAVVVDLNAINPTTVAQIAAVIAATGAAFVDGGIIGLPPRPGSSGPSLHVCGPQASAIGGELRALGLDMRVMDAPIGAASALKMSYAGITKGLTALTTMMVLGATRAGAQEALLAELAETQKPLLTRLSRAMPDMVPKAHRWVAEMREIAAFLEADPAAATVFEGIAQFYERMAAGAEAGDPEIAALRHFAKAAAAQA